MSKQKIEIENGKIKLPAFPEAAVISNDERKKFAFKEKGKSYIAENTKHQIGYCLRIDGILYTSDDGKKCDFGLLLEDARFFLIELKGENILTAYQQLIETYYKLLGDYPKYSFTFYGKVICSTGKNINAPSATTLRQRALKIFKSVEIKEKNFEEKI